MSHSLINLSRHLVIVSLVVGICLTAGVQSAQAAASPKPSASPSPTPSASPTLLASPRPAGSPDSSDSAKTNDAELSKIFHKTVEQVLGAANDTQQAKRGFIGEVERVTAETITLKTTKGTQILAITDQVALSKKGKSITVDDIAVGDWAMVIGQTSDDNFQPQIIEVSSTSLRPKNHLVSLGTITDISKTTLNFMARNQTQDLKLNITKTSLYQDAEANPLVFKTLTKQTQVLLIGEETDNGWEVSLVKQLATGQ